MTTVQRSVFIDAPPEAIQVLTDDASRLPEWYAGIESAEADDLFPQTGGKSELAYKAAGVTFRVTQTSVEYVAGDHAVFELEGMITGTTRWEFAPDGRGTRVHATFDYEMPGGVLGKIADKLIVERINEKNLEASLQNLKRLVENA